MPVINDQYDKRFNVKYFGAVGDGITDDSAAFNLAIQAALSAEGGGHVFVPHGRFALDPVQAGASILVLGAQNLTIEGVDKYSSVLTFTGDNDESCLLSFVDCDDIEIRDLGFDGRVTTSTRVPWNRAIDARGVLRLTLDTIHTKFTGNSALRVATKGLPGSDAIPHGTRPSESVILTNSRIEDAYGSGGILTKSAGANKVIITDNVFERIGIQAISLESEDAVDGVTDVRHGIHIVANNIINNTDAAGFGASTVGYGIAIQEFVHQQIISNNTITNIGGLSGIDLSTSSTQSDTLVEQTIIEGNYIDNVTQGSRRCGINLRSGDADLQNINIVGNSIYNTEYGVQFYPNTQTTTLGVIKDVKVGNNQIYVNNIGVWYNTVDGNTAAKNAVENIQINNNHIRARILGVQLLALNSQVANNFIRRSPGTPGWTHGVGIRAGSDSVEVYGNDVPDRATEASTRDAVDLNGLVSPWQIGNNYLWVDTSGRLRIADTSEKPDQLNMDTLGDIVGTQS